MHGGWNQEHISERSQLASSEAPDKEIDEQLAISQEEEKGEKIKVVNRQDEPVVIEYDPRYLDEKKEEEEDKKVAEELICIKLRSTMNLDSVEEEEAPLEEQKSLFLSFFEDVKGVAKNIFTDKKAQINEIQIANGPDYAEVYTEMTKIQGEKAHASLVWKLKNPSEEFDWAADMQLIPVMSSPTLKIAFDSKICQLPKTKTGQLTLRLSLPKDFTANHLILMLKLKQGRKFTGPLLGIFVKIMPKQSEDENSCEVSAFADAMDCELEAGSSGQSNSMDRQLKLINAGKDVYTDEQLLNMGSIVADQGYASFDRCMLVLRTLRGDIEKARVVLSQITFAEAQVN